MTSAYVTAQLLASERKRESRTTSDKLKHADGRSRARDLVGEGRWVAEMLREAENELRVGIGDYTVAFTLSNAANGATQRRWSVAMFESL